jgi:putative oxygen-independent coproporphyrinogen III oxidase
MSTHPLNPAALKAQRVSFKTLPPLSLYIHIPWCVRKCPYCDFNSHEVRGAPAPLSIIPQSAAHGLDPALEQRYVAALVRDLELALPQVWGRRFYSIFFGGGTPSLLSGAAVAEILRQVRTLLPLDMGAEVTLEANPGTAEAERFAAYREAGVNRLSLGIQSFDDDRLRALGRIHSADEARRAIEMAQRHFDNINLDLMYALPEQKLADALRDVETALSFAPQHLSCYHLTLEPNTLFYHNPPPLPDDDASAGMQAQIEQALAARGYVHYETSAFALPGWQARHNLNYWQFGDYLGIGAGAHSKLSFPDRVLRQARYKQPRAYMDQVALGEPVQTADEVGADDLAFEFMMNALRLTEGFNAVLFEERTSLSLAGLRAALEEAERRGLLTRQMKESGNAMAGQAAVQQRIAPTEVGRRFLNDLLQLFLPR